MNWHQRRTKIFLAAIAVQWLFALAVVLALSFLAAKGQMAPRGGLPSQASLENAGADVSDASQATAGLASSERSSQATAGVASSQSGANDVSEEEEGSVVRETKQ